MSAKLDSRLTAVEAHTGPDATFPDTCLSAVGIQPGPALTATGLSLTVMEKSPGPVPAPCTPSGANGWATITSEGTDASQPAQPVDPALGQTQTPPWSLVVSDGH